LLHLIIIYSDIVKVFNLIYRRKKRNHTLKKILIVGKQIGAGTHGQVFRGTDLQFNTPIAVKIVPEMKLSAIKFKREITV